MTATFHLLPNPVISTSDIAIASLDTFFSNWRHSIKDLGGNWQADGTIPVFNPETGIGMTSAQMYDFFLTNLGKRIKVAAGGRDYYAGQIARLELMHKGQKFVRTLEELKTRIKIIYSKVGPQLLTNGDVETGLWTQVGTPSTFEISTTWWAKGTQSMHIVSDAANEGATVEDGGSPANITITAATAYTASVIVNVVSGVWTLQVVDAATPADVIASRVSSETGREWLQCQVPDSNAVTSVQVRLVCADAAQEIYADSAIFRKSSVRSETAWTADTIAESDFGRIESVLLEGEMTDDEADAVASRELAERSWARTQPADRGSSGTGGKADQLIISCLGLAWTISWRYALTDGTDQADNHVTNLIDESQFFSSSNAVIDTNTTEVLLESSNPVTVWKHIKKVLESGDGAGNQWQGGGYPGFIFRFEPRPTGLQYEFKDGQMRHINGAAVDPLEFVPGWCLMTDMPLYPRPGGAAAIDDPRRVWLNETWYVMKNGKATLEWAREKYGSR